MVTVFQKVSMITVMTRMPANVHDNLPQNHRQVGKVHYKTSAPGNRKFHIIKFLKGRLLIKVLKNRNL